MPLVAAHLDALFGAAARLDLAMQFLHCGIVDSWFRWMQVAFFFGD